MEEQMGAAYDLLFRHLKFGLRILERCGNEGLETRMRDSVYRLFWQYLEALDGTDQLVREGVIRPASIHARTLFEIGLQLLYLLRQDDQALAAVYTTARRRDSLATAERMEKCSEKWKELKAEAQKSKIVEESFVERIPNQDLERKRLEESLQGELWKEANEELERIGKKPWYYAYGGPPNLRELAREMGFPLAYRFFYKGWSRVVHGLSPEKVLIPDREAGEVKIRPLREPKGWKSLVEICYTFTIRVFERVLTHFRPGEHKSVARWYRDEVRPKLQNSPLRVEYDHGPE